MNTPICDRHLKEVLLQMENLRLSSPVRKNDKTDDNKENILAGQDISTIKSDEKVTETPVFNLRGSNQSVYSIDKLNDIVNLEDESKNLPPPHPATDSKSSVCPDVEIIEFSPENCACSDPFIYHCSNIQQTVVKKDHSDDVIEEQASGNSLNCITSFNERDIAGGNRSRSFISKNDLKPLFTSVEFEQAPIEIVSDLQESKISLDPEKISDQSNSLDRISRDFDCEGQGVCDLSVKTEVLIANSRIYEEPKELPSDENNLNSTCTISTELKHTITDSPATPHLPAVEILEENTPSIAFTDNQEADSTFLSDQHLQPELSEDVEEDDAVENSAELQLEKEHILDFAPTVPEINDPEINLEVSSGNKLASEFRVDNFPERNNEETHYTLPCSENILEKHNPNFEEFDACDEKINSELSNSVVELSVCEDCNQVEETEIYSTQQINSKEMADIYEKNNVKELEEALKEAKAKESHALEELNARINDELNYRKIMEEYEKTIAARIADSQKLKEENEIVTRHLGNLEHSFSDLHQKYERTKNIIHGFKTNEERLREKFVVFEETIRKQEEKYESLKAHARAQIEKSNKEIIHHREKYDIEVNKLNAIIKRLEIKIAALETSLDQKTNECIALAALCDEVTGKKV